MNKSTTSEFIVKANKVHDNWYDYSQSNYIKNSIAITIICPEHGSFEQTPQGHLSGRGCQECGKDRCVKAKMSNTTDFIQKSIAKHGQKYDYSLVNYTHYKDKVEIICPNHGSFFITPNNHLTGKGCRDCSLEYCTFKKKDWIKKANGKIGKFYIILCWNENEIFLKLGITYNNMKKRYSCYEDMPYNWRVVKIVESKDLSYIWDLEKRFKKTKRKSRYLPKLEFGGSKTECFV